MLKKPPRTSRLAERRAARPATIDPAQLYSIAETCAALDVSRAQFYRLLHLGRINPAPALDERLRISGAEITRLSGTAVAAATS